MRRRITSKMQSRAESAEWVVSNISNLRGTVGHAMPCIASSPVTPHHIPCTCTCTCHRNVRLLSAQSRQQTARIALLVPALSAWPSVRPSQPLEGLWTSHTAQTARRASSAGHILPLPSNVCHMSTYTTLHCRVVEQDTRTHHVYEDPGLSIPGMLGWILGPGTCIPKPSLCVLSPIEALPHLGELQDLLLVALHLRRVVLSTTLTLPPRDYILSEREGLHRSVVRTLIRMMSLSEISFNSM
jgi:hypothetical protein